MKRLTTAPSIILINHYRNLLRSEGIDCFLRNEHLGSIVGEMPFQEVWPELWITNDLDFDRALQIIDTESLLEESPGETWRCSNCGEDNEGQFAACWSCGLEN